MPPNSFSDDPNYQFKLECMINHDHKITYAWLSELESRRLDGGVLLKK